MRSASGKGLHEYVNSLGNNLDQQLIKKIRYIASVRNQVVHDANFSLTAESKQSFLQAYAYCEKALNLPRVGARPMQFRQKPSRQPKPERPYIPEEDKKPIWELIKEKQENAPKKAHETEEAAKKKRNAETSWRSETNETERHQQEKKPIWETIKENQQQNRRN